MIEQVQETAQLWRLYWRRHTSEWRECSTPPIFTETAAIAVAEFMLSHYNAHIGAPAMEMAVKCDERTSYRIIN